MRMRGIQILLIFVNVNFTYVTISAIVSRQTVANVANIAHTRTAIETWIGTT